MRRNNENILNWKESHIKKKYYAVKMARQLMESDDEKEEDANISGQ